MLELPEAYTIANQITERLSGRRILHTLANQNPHTFAWYTGDPAEYPQKLNGKTIHGASSYGGHVEVQADEMRLVFSTSLRVYGEQEKRPPKHQLLLEFDDCGALVSTVQMWGCMLCFPAGERGGMEDYQVAKLRPSPLGDDFTRAHFDSLFDEETPKLSAKEFLATRQRIPGLGNGVLQDILWTAKIHPKRKMATLASADIDAMYQSVLSVMREMARLGGRDTERDLFGRTGGYRTVLSKNTVGKPCPACGTAIKKEPFMGGSIYACEGCQVLVK